MSLARVWNLAGVVVVLLILLLGYVVGVSPALTAASESDSELETVEAQNQVKTAELAALKALSEDSDQLFADLAELDIAIPPTHNTSVFANRIDALAAAAGVAFVEVSYSTVTDALAPVDETAVTPSEIPEGEVDGDVEAAPAEAPAADQAVASVPGLVSLAVNISVSGPPAAVHKFLASVQFDKRSFSISSIDLNTDSDAGVSELGIIGSVYVLTSNTAALVQDTTSGDEVN